MKLIIDIPDKVYEGVKALIAINFGGRFSGKGLAHDSLRAIKNGVPLDDVKAEIRELRDSWEKDCYHDEAEALNLALKIIDKHVGKESEESE